MSPRVTFPLTHRQTQRAQDGVRVNPQDSLGQDGVLQVSSIGQYVVLAWRASTRRLCIAPLTRSLALAVLRGGDWLREREELIVSLGWMEERQGEATTSQDDTDHEETHG